MQEEVDEFELDDWGIIMDTSLKYVQMCERATELQKLWGFIRGDYFSSLPQAKMAEAYETEMFSIVETFWFEDELTKKGRPEEWVWLPRQDQLQTIAGVDDDEGIIGKWIEWGFVKWAEDKSGRVYRSMRAARCCSMEQSWMAYVMYAIYNKCWNGTDWV